MGKRYLVHNKKGMLALTISVPSPLDIIRFSVYVETASSSASHHSSVSSSLDSSVISLILSALEATEEQTNFVLDTSVATMILDRDSWRCNPLDCLVSISGLGVAVQRVPQGEEPDQHITRLRKSLAAREWYSQLQNTLNSVHITSTVFIELKNPKKV